MMEQAEGLLLPRPPGLKFTSSSVEIRLDAYRFGLYLMGAGVIWYSQHKKVI